MVTRVRKENQVNTVSELPDLTEELVNLDCKVQRVHEVSVAFQVTMESKVLLVLPVRTVVEVKMVFQVDQDSEVKREIQLLSDFRVHLVDGVDQESKGDQVVVATKVNEVQLVQPQPVD